ncbi:nitroreductase family protein [Flammeovirga kamogawensis]|uniref:Putative NAD(P)H nitroreductase n=1 Tax=Flammeovirga kamogawensis TaxID=373891 RepID=A0ABX8GYN3_9BACT|nr:nitroreductase [Flammeovirga kamogawensis]MBB6460866.1 nitroreductase [Flammeovirga kamogawensis]QWG08212.1 nitroreductase [Flammeovirga kamogawensis]TRX70016.1 nitroreductase [Flammeovirga kamogawensis]
MASEISAIIKGRRSFYPHEFIEGEIPKKDIEVILENANWAPNHGMTEPWRFFVFAGNGLESLSEAQGEIYKENTNASEFDEKRYEKLKRLPLQSSHVIAIIMQRGNNKKIPVIEEVEAVACAVQNMALTVTEMGYGAYWSTGGMVKFKEAKEFFGLREEDQLLGLFYIGKVVTTKKDGKRGVITDKVTWVND